MMHVVCDVIEVIHQLLTDLITFLYLLAAYIDIQLNNLMYIWEL